MKINWNKKGFIEKLFINNINMIFPWGIEFAGSESFFSLEKGGWKSIKSNFNFKKVKNNVEGFSKIKLTDGNFDLNFKDRLIKNEIHREAELKANKESYLLDFVIRYRFRKKYFDRALINNKYIYHKNSNLYYQEETKEVSLFGSGIEITVSILESTHPKNMKTVMYVRDMGDEWIIHCRIIPVFGEKNVIKLNVPWYNKAIPSKISDLIILSKKAKNSLKYRGEIKKTSKFNLLYRVLKPTLYPLARINNKEELYMSTLLKINT